MIRHETRRTFFCFQMACFLNMIQIMVVVRGYHILIPTQRYSKKPSKSPPTVYSGSENQWNWIHQALDTACPSKNTWKVGDDHGKCEVRCFPWGLKVGAHELTNHHLDMRDLQTGLAGACWWFPTFQTICRCLNHGFSHEHLH